jgi:hypothetical protein
VSDATFDLVEYRRERSAKLERENDYLRGERDRTERLLALALEVAVAKTNVSPLALLEVLAAYLGTDLARPAWLEQRERREAQLAADQKLLQLLRETAP